MLCQGLSISDHDMDTHRCVSLSMRTTGEFRLAGTSGCIWSNLCLKAGSDQVAQGFIQQSLENFPRETAQPLWPTCAIAWLS